MNESTVKYGHDAGFGSFLIGLLQIILNPEQGWFDARKDDYASRDLLVRGLCPFLVIVGVSALVNAFYRSSLSVFEAIVKGCIDFAGYFVSVFIGNFLLTWCLKKWIRPTKMDENQLMTYIIYTIGSMSFITLIDNLMPVDLALISFLPLYVIYILFSGFNFVGIREDKKYQFLFIALLSVFVPPYVLSYCLSLFV